MNCHVSESEWHQGPQAVFHTRAPRTRDIGLGVTQARLTVPERRMMRSPACMERSTVTAPARRRTHMEQPVIIFMHSVIPATWACRVSTAEPESSNTADMAIASSRALFACKLTSAGTSTNSNFLLYVALHA